MAAQQLQVLQEELFASRNAFARAQKEASDLSAKLEDTRAQNDELRAQIHSYQDLQETFAESKIKAEQLEGRLAAQEGELKRLRGRNTILAEEITSAHDSCDMKTKELSQAQGAAALHKAKLDEQTMQIRLLKQQLLDMEEDVAAAEHDAQQARNAMKDSRSPGTPSTNFEAGTLQAENAMLHARLSELEETMKQQSTFKEDDEKTKRRNTKVPFEENELLALSASNVKEMSMEALQATLLNSLELNVHLHRKCTQELRVGEVLNENTTIDQLGSLTDSLKMSEMHGEVWQAQAQSALSQVEQLKDMLYECANWTDDKPAPAVASDDKKSDALIPESSEYEHAHKAAVEHAAKCTDLELLVRALLAENARAIQMSAQVGRSTLPSLYSIESRLVEMLSQTG